MKSNLWTKGSIFATFMVCCVVLALLSSSLATDYWVTATGNTVNGSSIAEVNLGLFKGMTLKQHIGVGRGYTVKFVCLNNDTESPCMYSCGTTSDDRTEDIADLFYNNGSAWNQNEKCAGEDVSAARPPTLGAAGGGDRMMSLLLTIGGGPLLKQTVSSVADVPQTEPEFMSYGLWLSTIIMLGAAIAFTLVAAMFAILNTATTPVETIFGVLGLYVWNAIAMVFELLALSLWGAQFHQHLQHSVLWREEVVQQWTTEGNASLGYSYWLVFVAMFLHAINMGVLWFGTHQMKPKTVHVPVEREPNAANMIY